MGIKQSIERIQRELAALDHEPTVDEGIAIIRLEASRLEAEERAKPRKDGVQVFDGTGHQPRATTAEDEAFIAEATSKHPVIPGSKHMVQGCARFEATNFDWVDGSGRLGEGEGPTTTRITYGNGAKLEKVAEDVRRLRLLLGRVSHFDFRFRAQNSGMGVVGTLTDVTHDKPRSFVFTVDQDQR